MNCIDDTVYSVLPLTYIHWLFYRSLFAHYSVAEVRKICQHYVRKTAGKYVDNVTAARYIHQMAEDVLSQLADVSAEIKRHESPPEMYQELLDSWNEVKYVYLFESLFPIPPSIVFFHTEFCPNDEIECCFNECRCFLPLLVKLVHLELLPTK